jgi:hypothetical protein
MNWRRIGLVIPLLGRLAGPTLAQSGLSSPLSRTGMCDASAAVAVGADLFVVANDEDNVLRVYRTRQAGGPVASFPIDSFLDIELEHPAADIEGRPGSATASTGSPRTARTRTARSGRTGDGSSPPRCGSLTVGLLAPEKPGMGTGPRQVPPRRDVLAGNGR